VRQPLRVAAGSCTVQMRGVAGGKIDEPAVHGRADARSGPAGVAISNVAIFTSWRF
jgi:hypothetical protein